MNVISSRLCSCKMPGPHSETTASAIRAAHAATMLRHQEGRRRADQNRYWYAQCHTECLALMKVMMSSKSCSCKMSGSHSATTASAMRSSTCGRCSCSSTSMTRLANLAGKGHEKHVRNHCDAYSTGSAVYSCTQHCSVKHPCGNVRTHSSRTAGHHLQCKIKLGEGGYI